jgi:hypothetical protein
MKLIIFYNSYIEIFLYKKILIKIFETEVILTCKIFFLSVSNGKLKLMQNNIRIILINTFYYSCTRQYKHYFQF